MKILIADDDLNLRELVKDILEIRGFEVIEAEDGIRAIEYFRQISDLDLVILDIMMPGKDGFAVLKEIRKTSQIPVIMLTALGNTKYELQGFEAGACDYISKPFHTKILVARIEAALMYKNNSLTDNRNIMKEGSLEINLDSCQVFVNGKNIELTLKEYQLLLYLWENKNIVLTRNQILERIWGYDYTGDIRTIDTHIKMLRTDLDACGNYIRTVRGIGYMFRKEDE